MQLLFSEGRLTNFHSSTQSRNHAHLPRQHTALTFFQPKTLIKSHFSSQKVFLTLYTAKKSSLTHRQHLSYLIQPLNKKETYVSPEHTDSQNSFTNKGFLYIFTFSRGSLYNNTWGARTPSSLCSYIGSLSLQTRLYGNLLYTPTYQSQQTALSLSTHQQTIFRPLRHICNFQRFKKLHFTSRSLII